MVGSYRFLWMGNRASTTSINSPYCDCVAREGTCSPFSCCFRYYTFHFRIPSQFFVYGLFLSKADMTFFLYVSALKVQIIGKNLRSRRIYNNFCYSLGKDV